MAKPQRRRAQTRPYTAESCSYVSQTTTETTVTRTTTVTTIFPPFQHPQPSNTKDSSLWDSVTSSEICNSSSSLVHPNGSHRTEKALPATPHQKAGIPAVQDPPTSSLTPLTNEPTKNGLRRAASYSALSLARASLGIGVTPAVPAVVPPSHFSAQETRTPTIHQTERRSSTTRILSGQESLLPPVANGQHHPTTRLEQTGSRDRGNYTDAIGQSRDVLVEHPGVSESDSVTAGKSGSLKRPLLWRLRVTSFGPATRRPSRTQTPEPPLPTVSSTAPESSNDVVPKGPAALRSRSWKTAASYLTSNHSSLPDSRDAEPSSGSRPMSSKTTCSPSHSMLSTPRSSLERRPSTTQQPHKTRRRSHTITAGPGPKSIKEPTTQLPASSLQRSSSLGGGSSRRRSSVSFSDTIHIMHPRSSHSRSELGKGTRRISGAEIDTSPEERPLKKAPAISLKELLSSVSKAEAVNILASSSGEAEAAALRNYLDRYDFTDEPIDLSLRAMLAETGLPKETQQIDRVLEAFAKRYCQCNPGVFSQDDHAYIIAFSLIMLHTDAFNKSNKNKMTKTDYIKNTQLTNISPQYLEYLYDNILFAPFVFLENSADENAMGKLSPADLNDSSAVNDSSESGMPISFERHRSTDSSHDERFKMEGYRFLTNRAFTPFTIAVDDIIPPFDPYLYRGTLDDWDDVELSRTFSEAPYIEVRERTPFPEVPILMHGLTVGGVGGVYLRTPVGPSSPPSEDRKPFDETWTLKITKAGLLLRKDDLVEGGKRSTNRKWREWSVILTGSQLLFFRDPSLASSLLVQATVGGDRCLHSPHMFLRPEEIISLKDCVAVYDMTYSKHSNTFRFVLSNGRHLLLRAQEEHTMNEWIHLINYASAFRSTGLKLRTLEPLLRKPPLRSVAEDTILMSAPPGSVAVDGDSPPQSPQDTPFIGESKYDDHGILDSSHSRHFVLSSKLRNLTGKITAVESELESNLRICRQYSLAFPFQKATRDRIQSLLPSLSKKIQSLRLELAKLRCYQFVLDHDLSHCEDAQKRRSMASHTSQATRLLKDRKDSISEVVQIPTSPSSNCNDCGLRPVSPVISRAASPKPKHHVSSSISSLSSVFSPSNVAGWGSLLFPQQGQTETNDIPHALPPMLEE